jgi:glycosyltransferase involved in cell wall biosynthesis
MRIALVGPAHPYKGGGARHTTELAHRLAAAGHNVIIESWRAQYPSRLYPGQQTVTAQEGTPYPRTYRRLSWYRPDGWYAAGRRLATADLVVLALLTPVQAPAYLAMLGGLGTKNRPRTVVLCHNVLPHERRPGDVALTRTLLSHADTALVHSAQQATAARELASDLSIVIARMPPHLPQGGFGGMGPPDPGGSPGGSSPREAALHLLFFGIVRPYKGLDVLLRAMALAPPSRTLTVAGEFWGGTGDTEKLIADLGLGTRVTLRPGYVPADEIPALFAAADALVLPYREATASQNASLAFSYGVPVITTTAGALADQVCDGVNGLTCAPGDVEGLARTLTAFSRPGTAERLRAAVRPVDPEPLWTAYLKALLAP